jgi:hypothetical protein
MLPSAQFTRSPLRSCRARPRWGANLMAGLVRCQGIRAAPRITAKHRGSAAAVAPWGDAGEVFSVKAASWLTSPVSTTKILEP